MPRRWRVRIAGCAVALAPVTVLTACGGGGPAATTPAATASSTTPPASASTTLAPPAPRRPVDRPAATRPWVDLQVGDCLADPPPTDPAVVMVPVVDCAAPHAAEVFSRASVPVNAAVADVADRECAAGFRRYTGGEVAGSGYAVTYLIDSMQDRTGAVPEPSTVICLLHADDGAAVTGTAQH